MRDERHIPKVRALGPNGLGHMTVDLEIKTPNPSAGQHQLTIFMPAAINIPLRTLRTTFAAGPL